MKSGDIRGLLQALGPVRQQVFDQLESGRKALGRWHDRAHAEFEQVETREAETAPAAGVPQDAPAEYQAVAERVARGEYTWFDVLAGDVEDPAARPVHTWLTARMDLALAAGQAPDDDPATDAAGTDVVRH
jgi:hypothetical protein